MQTEQHQSFEDTKFSFLINGLNHSSRNMNTIPPKEGLSYLQKKFLSSTTFD